MKKLLLSLIALLLLVSCQIQQSPPAETKTESTINAILFSLFGVDINKNNTAIKW
jgi:uncharacterized protein YcfL